MKPKKKTRRRNRAVKIKTGCLVTYGGTKRGIYMGMGRNLAQVKTGNGIIEIPFKNLTKVLEQEK